MNALGDDVTLIVRDIVYEHASDSVGLTYYDEEVASLQPGSVGELLKLDREGRIGCAVEPLWAILRVLDNGKHAADDERLVRLLIHAENLTPELHFARQAIGLRRDIVHPFFPGFEIKVR